MQQRPPAPGRGPRRPTRDASRGPAEQRRERRPGRPDGRTRTPDTPRPPAQAGGVFLTTQPGWAFATLAELRRRGIDAHVDLVHRDSTLVVPPLPGLLRGRLKTVEQACGTVLAAHARGDWDATRGLAQALRSHDLQPAVWRWLRETRRERASQFSVGSEMWGNTAVRRREVADVLRDALRRAFPRWREQQSGGVRLTIKADVQQALVGVQLYSNLAEHGEIGEGRPGSLREHLAYALLEVAGTDAGDAVVDPFMGTGTILRAAAHSYEASACIGMEVDREAFRLADGRVPPEPAALRLGAFDEIDVAALPAGVRLVSNLPFGDRFAQVETARLAAFLESVRPRLAGAALLLSREQGAQIAQPLGLRVKHVLVLGKPAAITYWVRTRMSK